jgi:LuxR family maltose regulon positive regulatory protein
MKRLPGDSDTALPRPVLPVLTPRELEAVQLRARQMSTTQIAAAMSISVDTVRTCVRQALRKLETDDREGAVRTARDRGLV